MSILDQVMAATADKNSPAVILGQQHDVNQIAVEESAIASALAANSSVPGAWDASEYGITAAEAQARIDAATTPEARAAVMKDLRDRAIKRAGLDTSNGRVNMFSATVWPWTKLGVLISKACNSKQAIEFAGLNWKVEKTPVFYIDNKGVQREIKDRYTLTRSDTGAYLCEKTVGRVYKPIQNEEAFDFLDTILDEFGARYETAGSIYGGKKVWMLVHLPKQAFKINGKDAIEPYAIFTNPHDGEGKAYCYPTEARVVCANTYRISMSERGKGIGFHHSGNIKDKIKEAKKTLGMTVSGMEKFKLGAELMASTKVKALPYINSVLDETTGITQDEIKKGIPSLLDAMALKHDEARDNARKMLEKKIERRGEILDDILERYESEKNGVGGMRGTGWAAFNAVTEHADHNTIGRQVGTAAERADRRFESVLTGTADDMKQIAYEKVMTLVTA